MIARVIGWITGGALDRIGGHLKDAYLAKQQAQTDEQKLEADILIRQLQARESILIAEQSSGVTRWIRPAFALPFIIYNFKVLVWDQVLELGVTNNLSAQFWELQMIVFGAYFLARPIEKIAKRWGS